MHYKWCDFSNDYDGGEFPMKRMLIRITAVNAAIRIGSIAVAAFMVFLLLPSSAAATVILNLTSSNPDFATNFPSAKVFTDPAGLGWDLTVGSGTPAAISTSSSGLGVLGNGDAMGGGEGIIFEFNPNAVLEGFTVNLASNDTLMYVAVGDSNVMGFEVVPSSTPSYFVAVSSTATSLTVSNISFGNPNSQFRMGSISFYEAVVPEPGTLSLLGAGLVGLGLARRRRTA